MKKRILALLCGGVMAVSALVLQMPVEVQAADFGPCNGSGSHVKSNKVENVDGKLSVTIDIVFESGKGAFDLYVFPKELGKEDEGDDTFININDKSKAAEKRNLTKSGTYTFDGLTSGTTYYVYYVVCDDHENELKWEEPALLGSVKLSSASSGSSSSGSSSSGSSSQSAQPSYEEKVTSQIMAAQSGSTVVMEKGISALSNSIMQELLAKGDVSLRLEFTYKDQEYVIIIPAGAALDNDIPWYGPLYLAQQFGNRAGMEDAATSVTEETSVENTESTVYEVRSGDTMSKIAATNHMTLTELLAKNPQIKNPDKIRVGQQINL